MSTVTKKGEKIIIELEKDSTYCIISNGVIKVNQKDIWTEDINTVYFLKKELEKILQVLKEEEN